VKKPAEKEDKKVKATVDQNKVKKDEK